MRHLKRLIFTLLGIAFITAPTIGIIYAITQQNENKITIGPIIGLTVLGILITFLMCIMGAAINKIIEDSGIIIFPAFFMVAFKKRKRLYHSTMGEFELIIDEEDMKGTLIKQSFFSCLNIATFVLYEENFMDNIKRHLDTRYKEEIKKKEERKRKKEFIGKLMKEEGYLDTAGKRDDKLTKIGIK